MTDRLPPSTHRRATPEQKAVLDEILSGPRGNLNGPFLGWIRKPPSSLSTHSGWAHSAATARACRCVCPNWRYS